MTQPGTQPAEPVLPGVYRISCPFGDGGVVHVYFLDAPEPALIDTGVRPSPSQAIAPALAAAGRDLAAVRHVFNTHGHWDHMGGNEAARAIARGARTYAHAADAALFADVANHVAGYSNYPGRLTGDADALALNSRMLRSGVETPTPVDVQVEDGQTISLGGTITLRAVHTPGHSLGSTSYLLEPGGALFTGDGLQGMGSRPGQLPLVFEDSRAYRATILRLAELPFHALCMGHSFCGISPGTGRDSVRQGSDARAFLEESGEAAKAVEEAMRSAVNGRRDAPFLDVARTVFASLAPALGVEVGPSGLNVRSLATLHAFYRELTGAPRPS